MMWSLRIYQRPVLSRANTATTAFSLSMTVPNFTACTGNVWGIWRCTSKRAASCRKDKHPPLPVTAAWEEKPRAVGDSVVMKAARAVDPYGVEYLFEEYVDGVLTDSSGWQESRECIFHGRKKGVRYSYRVVTRDKWHIPAPEPIPAQNTGNGHLR